MNLCLFHATNITQTQTHTPSLSISGMRTHTHTHTHTCSSTLTCTHFQVTGMRRHTAPCPLLTWQSVRWGDEQMGHLYLSPRNEKRERETGREGERERERERVCVWARHMSAQLSRCFASHRPTHTHTHTHSHSHTQTYRSQEHTSHI